VLADLWRAALGVATVTAEDDFFALGGESMALVQLVSVVRARAGVPVSLSELALEPTFGRLHDLATRAQDAHHTGLVPLSTAGSGVPLFLAADAFGTTMAYRELAGRLGTDRPVFGVEPAAARRTRIEEIAEAGVRAVRSAQPRGPYVLGGWSFGAVVAHEMARRLLAAGEQVDGLVCIDGYVADTGGLPMVVRPDFAWDGLRLQVAAALGLGPVGALARGRPDERRRFTGSLRAVWRYRPRPLDCPAVLFKAGASPDDLGRLRRRLSGLYRGGLLVEHVAGGHWSLLADPHVTRLAERIRAVLPTPMSSQGTENAGLST
jgi:phthiocerol/phenolphthiocerol synthesis type-I polyketide synthase E